MQINTTNLSTAQACTKLSVSEGSCMLDEFSKPDNTEEIDTPKRPSDNLVAKKAMMDNIIVDTGTIHAGRSTIGADRCTGLDFWLHRPLQDSTSVVCSTSALKAVSSGQLPAWCWAWIWGRGLPGNG